jgi:hypothetical protein
MVPNYAHVPRKLYETGLYDLKSHDGQAAFVDACVATLNGIDSNFRHLKKRADQTHVHRHGEDSVLYLLPNNRALAVDFIGGAGGANPQPGWGVGEHVYTHADAHDPDDHGIGAVAQLPKIPSYAELGDDAFFRAMIGVPLFADYAVADANGHPDAKPNDGMSAWLARPIYRLIVAFLKANGQPIDPVGEVRIVRNEWRAILGLPPV